MQTSNTANDGNSNPAQNLHTTADTAQQRGQITEDGYPHRGHATGDREIVSTRVLILREELQYEDIA